MADKYLNENTYKRGKTILIVVGCISIIIGILLLISVLTTKVPEMTQAGWFEAKQGQMVKFAGVFLTLIMIPLMTFTLAFRRSMTAFALSQQMPIMEEATERMAPATEKHYESMAKGIAQGINSSSSANSQAGTMAPIGSMYCKHCGTLIDADSTYCSKCGKAQ